MTAELRASGPGQPKIRAAAYLRCSTTEQAEKGLSIPSQLRDVERYADREGYAISAVFVDEGISGTTTARPQFQAMMREALSRDRRFDLVLVYDLSRFGRSDADSMFRRQLADAGVLIDSVTESISGESGELVADILSSIHRQYSRQLSKVVSRGQREATRQGRYASGSLAPTGYKWEFWLDDRQRRQRRLVVDESIGPVISSLFLRYVEGASISSLTRWLNATIPSPAVLNGLQPRGRTHGIWLGRTVHQMLRNPAYVGDIAFGKRRIKKLLDGRELDRRQPRSTWEIYKDAHPPIVTRDVFERAQLRLAGQRPIPRRDDRPATLLGLLARCAACGGHACVDRNQNGWLYVSCRGWRRFRLGDARCRHSIRLETVEDALAAQLSAILLAGSAGLHVLYHDSAGQLQRPNASAIDAAVADYNRAIENGGIPLAALPIRRVVENLEKQQRRLIDALAEGTSSVAVMAKIADLDSRIAQETARLEAATAELRARFRPLDVKDVTKDAAGLASALLSGDRQTMRDLLPKLITAARIDFSYDERHARTLAKRAGLQLDTFGILSVQMIYDVANIEAAQVDSLRAVSRISVVP